MFVKVKRVIAALLLAAVASTSALVGCGGTSGGGSGLLEEYADRPKTVAVLHNKAGYGDQWLIDVAKYYMDNVDTETYINIKNTPLDAEEGIKLSSGLQTHDVYILGYTYDYATAGTYLVDLKDIYDGKSTGENVYVKDKISDQLEKALYPAGTDAIYYLPYMGKSGYFFCYNTTTIDEALGKGTYRLPRTTDELFEFGDRLKAQGVALTAGAYGDATDYFSVEPWLAQAMGVENYLQARAGNYKNSEGKWVLAEDAPHMITDNAQAYKDVYEVSSKLAKKSNSYIHKDSASMGFLDVEGVLAGNGFYLNKTKIAYHYNGAYIMNEMEPYLKVMEEKGEPQTIRAEKIPMMSSVVRHTPSITGTDEQKDLILRDVIDYIDGGKTGEKPASIANVSDTDIAFIEQARNVSGMHMGGSIAIGKKTENLEGSKDFVRFFTTDIAQKIARDALNGVEMLPYGYQPEETEDLPQFTKDVSRISKNLIYINANVCADDLFLKYGEFQMLPYPQAGMEAFANEAGMSTPDEYYEKTLKYYTDNNRWQTIINNYKRALGEL